MKNVTQALAVAVIGTGILSLQSCKKYEDGPLLSLRTKKARLTGEWELVDATNIALPTTTGIIFEFEKDGDFKLKIHYSYPGYSYTYSYRGKWEWTHRKERVDITLDGETVEYEILRLTNKELTLDYYNVYEFEFEKL